MAKTNKIRKPRIDPEVKRRETLEQDILPASQVGAGLYIVVDAPSMQGETSKSGSKAQTLKRRRSTHIEMLLHRHTFTGIVAIAFEDYANMHAARHDTVGVTAQWGGAPGARRTDYNHLPKTPEQKHAYLYLARAEQALGADLQFVESIILHEQPVGREGERLRLAGHRLVDAMGTAENA